MSWTKRPWRYPLTLLTLCLIPFLLTSKDAPDSLIRRLKAGDCEALPVLAAHHPEQLTIDLMLSLADQEDARLKELVAHQAWIPHVSLHDQLIVTGTLEPADVRKRAMLWINRRTTSKDTLTRDDLDSYWLTKDR